EIGQQKEISGSIPSDHPEEKLRDKKAVYKVTLNTLSEKILPEVDDDFAKTLEMEVETLLELRLKLRGQIEEQVETDRRADVHAKILDQVLDVNPFLVPQVMIDEEIRNLLVRSGVIDPSKMDPSKISVEAFREKMGEVALKRVRTAILVDCVAEAENLRATKAELDKAMEEIAEKNGLPIGEVQKFFMDEGRVMGFSLEQTRNKVLDFLYGRAVVTSVPEEEKQEVIPPEADKSGDK
ncbi:hypothetical protein OAO01_06235, partial [Oligoflexia bacterium]|nr:hypothetical protein [Oligoflexia bacterium]